MTVHNISEIAHRYPYLVADSRAVFAPADTVFAALKTPLADGHDYINELYDRGVRAFIVDRLPDKTADDATYYLVEDVLSTLFDIAAQRTDGMNGGIVVTGSVGKTTMKELLYRNLITNEDVRCSPRSWNSGIGVPLALWSMTEDSNPAKHYITEVGIDGPGQASKIAQLLGHTHEVGIITPITEEHDEAFTSHRDKVLEKVRLVSNCKTVFYAAGDKDLEEILSAMPLTAVKVEQTEFPTIYHALTDAVMRYLGYDGADVKMDIVNKRREISVGNYDNILLRDSFTPDLRSLRDALDFMRRQSVDTHKPLLVLGRMLASPAMGHDELYTEAESLARQFGIDDIIPLHDDAAVDSTLTDFKSYDRLHHRQILIFGAADEPLTRFSDSLVTAGHDTILEVDLDALISNFNYYRGLVPQGTGLVAMVKASAYGLGSIEISKALQSRGAAYLAVAVIEEGIALRQAGITMPIMVLNPVTNRYPELFANHLEPAVFSIDELTRLISEAKAKNITGYPVHIKFDTGMHRVGFLKQQIEDIAEVLATTDAVKVTSAFSHLATADCLDMDDYTHSQLSEFYQTADALRHALGYDFKRHILNTAGMMRFAGVGQYEMARLGIGLYGISPLPAQIETPLSNVATFRSRIISLKHWPAGTPIGYGCKGRTTAEDSVVATVPVGYADGVNRRLGNGNTSFIVKGVPCPTIGNICMDLCMIDVTNVPGVKVGDSVEIFGQQMPVERLAEQLGTIPYEILTSVSPRVKRVYIKE